MQKVKRSSPTTGNPYGKTGAPGKETEQKPMDKGEESELYRMLGQMPQDNQRALDQARSIGRTGGPMTPAQSAEQNLLAAPAPKPQMPNLNALRLRSMPAMRPAGSAMPPPPPAPPPDPRLQALYSQYGIR
jgi:hypothetical protein